MNKKIRLILYLALLIIIQLFISFNWGIRPIMLQATTYNEYVDYSYYLVNNFNDYKPILNSDTANLDYYMRVRGSFDYETTYCPIDGKIANANLTLRIWNETQTQYIFSNQTNLAPIQCIQPYETYTFDVEIPLHEVVLLYGYDFTNAILNIDDKFFNIYSFIGIQGRSQYTGYNLIMSNIKIQTWLEIRFNNSYLMSTFLLESDQVDIVNYANDINRPFILYAENENNTYNVYNDNLSQSYVNRTKYAITIPNLETAIVVNKIGTGWESIIPNLTFTLTTSYQYIWQMYRFHTLNASPMATPFDDTVIDTAPNYAVCDYSLFGWPVDCTINNVPVNSFQAMGNDIWEWLSKESPIFGDIWTLASAGFQWFGNMFQFLGDFDPLSLLGGMITILVGVLLLGWAFKGG